MTTLTGSPRTAARQLCDKLGFVQTEKTPQEAAHREHFERKSIASAKACMEENINCFKAGLCSFSMDENGMWRVHGSDR